ncbi:uncharacterized protein [Watersipora subatra]|uniref:uncharacterized protein n=1 Tax=Watersipora subatra TaxID=2589382 RepID=UPI00355C4039
MSQPPHDGGNKVEEDNDSQRGQQQVSSRPQVGCTTRPQPSGTSLIQSNATNAIRQNADDESLDGILKGNPRDFKIVSQNWVEEWVGLMACDQLMYFDERRMLKGYNRSLLLQDMSKYTSGSIMKI